MSSREYERSHPWIRFEADLREAPPRLWALLGQAAALCRQVADAALPPDAAAEMRKVYLVKGVQATTAIGSSRPTLVQQKVTLRRQRPANPGDAGVQ